MVRRSAGRFPEVSTPGTEHAARRWPLSPRLTAVLLLARGTFRLVSVASPVALAPTWGEAAFGSTVAAIGTFSWVILWGTGAEKVVLKLLPRHPALDRSVSGTASLLVIAPLLVAVSAGAVGLLAAPDHGFTVLALALAWCTTIGLLQLSAALLRLRGLPQADALLFGTVSVGLVVATTLSAVADLSPTTWLTLIVVTSLASATGALWVAARRAPAGTRARGRVRQLTARQMTLLSATEVLTQVGVSVAFVALQLGGNPVEAGRFYIAISLSGLACAVVLYLLRLSQPMLSLRYHALGREAARAQALMASRWGMALALGLLLAVPATLWGPWAVLAVVTLVEVLTLCARLVAVNHVENSDGRSLRITVGSSAAGLVVSLLALPLVIGRDAAWAMGLVVVGTFAAALTMAVLISAEGVSRER